MTIYGSTLPGAASLARDALRTGSLTERAQYKLKVVDWHTSHGKNVSRTARHFGYTRKTIRTWHVQLTEAGPVGLNERSRAPKKRPVPKTPPDVICQIVALRREYPAWSKYKIREMLERDHNIITSASTVGRILKRRGLIDRKKSAKRKKAALRPKRRFPRGFSISEPGDMVQMDTKHLMLPGGRKIYQFTAIDVLTKQRVLRAYPSCSSRNGAAFLRCCIETFPFALKNVQTDNGPEFEKEFAALCCDLDLPHYYIYPRKKEQNAYVERSHGSDEQEFYQQGNRWGDWRRLDTALRQWQEIWNTVRPHESLGYKTPRQYFEELKGRNLPTKDVIILQA